MPQPGDCWKQDKPHYEHDMRFYDIAVALHNKYYGKKHPYNQSKYISDYYSARPTKF